MRTVAVAGGIACAALVSAAPVAAAEPPLRWSAPPGCPSERALNDAIQRGLPEPDAATRRKVTARAVIARDGDRYTVRLVIATDEATTERRFEGGTCDEVAAASALIVALAIDARAQVPALVAAPADALPAAPPSVAAPAASTRAPLRVSVLAGAALDGATLPTATFGAALGAAVARRPWVAEVEGALLAHRSAPGGRFGLATATVRGCLDVVPVIAPCVAGSLVLVSAEGRADATSERHVAWPALGPELLVRRAFGAEGALGHWAVRGTIGSLFPLRRPAFVVAEARAPELVVHRPAAVTVTAGIGLEATF